MEYHYVSVPFSVHRLIPSRFPTINFFDWAEDQKELDEIAELEGLTNERLLAERGEIQLVSKDDWVSGPGASVLMAAFAHRGASRFCDGTYGVYYAGDSLETAIAETKYHRERFLSGSNEAPCFIQMREYIADVVKELVDLSAIEYKEYLNPDPNQYLASQIFAKKLRENEEWGLHYPSVRKTGSHCVGLFRPFALTIPTPGCHLDYIWDGKSICDIKLSQSINNA